MQHPQPTNKRKPKGARECWCSGCGEMFNGITTFDMHRKGKGEDRRCLDPDEMIDAGLTFDPVRLRWD